MKSSNTIKVSELLSSVLTCIENGWPVFLTHSVKSEGGCTCEKVDCKSIGKHPRTTHGLKDATLDIEVIRQGLERFPESNLAMTTGACAGLFVLDQDPRHGGEDSLAALEVKHGPLPHTVQVLTGSGGGHFYFKHPGGRIPNRAGFLPGLDIRGDGGYVIVPPSRHVSGRSYAWEVSCLPCETPIAAAPHWLLDLILVEENSPLGKSSAYWENVASKGLLDGERNHTLTSVAGHLFRRYVSPSLVLELLLSWNASRGKPPLPESEVIKVVNSIAGRELKRRERQGGRYV